ncbi:GMC oxidoreductase [Rhodovulum steppense]|nr:GMC oxidoreductase [Rhodovulum steppense]
MAHWPIGRAELDPYYRIAARILGRDPTFLTFQQDHLDGFRLRPFSTEPPVHFGDPEFGVPEDDPMIDIALNTTLAGLRPRLDRQGVDGIAIWSPGGGRIEARVAETQSIVLAAGGVGNAQILLASTDGTSAAVGNEADQVGRYLMEHPHSYHCGRVVVPSELALPEAPEPFGAQVPALVPDDSLHAQIGGRDVSVEWVETAPNLNDPHEVFLLDRIGPAARSFFLNVRSEMAADPVNRLTIGEGRDPAGLPRLRARCVIGADDLRAIDLCLEALGGRLVANGPGRLRILNDALYRGVTGGGHIMGTTRMGDDPRRSVVNRDCRVHGYRNLFVAGSSVFATGGYENPTLTIMALAARLGDHLADAA